LVTCYPFNYFGSAPKRFVVKAREVSRTALRQPSVQEPSPPEVVPVAQTVKSQATSTPGKVIFNVPMNHSRQLAPGISVGVTATDAGLQQMNGWMWLMPDRRTVWLHDQGVQSPRVFYDYKDGRRRELVITRVTRDSVMGYLIL